MKQALDDFQALAEKEQQLFGQKPTISSLHELKRKRMDLEKQTKDKIILNKHESGIEKHNQRLKNVRNRAFSHNSRVAEIKI